MWHMIHQKNQARRESIREGICQFFLISGIRGTGPVVLARYAGYTMLTVCCILYEIIIKLETQKNISCGGSRSIINQVLSYIQSPL